MGDTSLSVEQRVRYGAEIGAVLFSAIQASTAFGDVATDELRGALHRVVADVVLRPSDAGAAATDVPPTDRRHRG